MSELEWDDNHLPVSIRFDDPYYSREDGQSETRHVFIEGNNLMTRWPLMPVCTLAELGFGTGLNFLETVRRWLQVKTGAAKLNYISFEQFPMASEDIAKALSIWPDLEKLQERLLELWSLDKDRISVRFSEDVHLTVHNGDANELLPTLSFQADAWYLDGFSPAKNPELWNADLLRHVRRRTVAGGTFATYTAAGFVKRNLQAAGFEVKKSKGFGRKRDMLIGSISRDIDVADGY